ncbi:hypothetical protein GW17_00061588 [Ensete ventricosum]|nr:hypothetical protein GW17_00061588 [Ensete ventricosum]
MVCEKIRQSKSLCNVARELEFLSVFLAPSQKFKILAIPNVLVHAKSYEHGFTKKYDSHKHLAMSRANRVLIAFSCTISEIQNTGHSQRISSWEVVRASKVTREVEFRSIFRTPSPKFKILAIHNVLAHGKSYKHGFMKKRDGHKVCTKSRVKSSFDQFFVQGLRNSKYWPFPTLTHGKSYEHGFTKKHDGHKLCSKSRAKSSFDRFFVHLLENLKYWPFPTY